MLNHIEIKKRTFNTIYSINENFFKNESHDKWYVVGFSMSDGNMSKYSSRRLNLPQKEKDILESINKVMDSNYLIKYYGLCYHLNICNQEICRDLIKLGVVPAKSLIIECPYVPDEYLADFVRGCFDGDGGAKLQQHTGCAPCLQIRIHSGSYKFLKKLQDMLANTASINCSLHKHGKNVNCWYLNILGGPDGYLKFFNFMYHDKMGDLYLNRKYQEFVEYFKRSESFVYNRHNRHNFWTESEIKFLTDNYRNNNKRFICSNLSNHTWAAIKAEAGKLRLTNKVSAWTDEENNFLKNNYNDGDEQFIRANVNHSWYAIKSKASRMGLKINR